MLSIYYAFGSRIKTQQEKTRIMLQISITQHFRSVAYELDSNSCIKMPDFILDNNEHSKSQIYNPRFYFLILDNHSRL